MKLLYLCAGLALGGIAVVILKAVVWSFDEDPIPPVRALANLKSDPKDRMWNHEAWVRGPYKGTWVPGPRLTNDEEHETKTVARWGTLGNHTDSRTATTDRGNTGRLRKTEK